MSNSLLDPFARSQNLGTRKLNLRARDFSPMTKLCPFTYMLICSPCIVGQFSHYTEEAKYYMLTKQESLKEKNINPPRSPSPFYSFILQTLFQTRKYFVIEEFVFVGNYHAKHVERLLNFYILKSATTCF